MKKLINIILLLIVVAALVLAVVSETTYVCIFGWLIASGATLALLEYNGENVTRQ